MIVHLLNEESLVSWSLCRFVLLQVCMLFFTTLIFLMAYFLKSRLTP